MSLPAFAFFVILSVCITILSLTHLSTNLLTHPFVCLPNSQFTFSLTHPFTYIFLGAFPKLRKATISFVMSVSPSVRNVTPTGWNFMKFDIWVFFENMSRKLTCHWNLIRIKGTSHEDQCTSLITSRWTLLRVRKVSVKICREVQNLQFRSIYIQGVSRL